MRIRSVHLLLPAALLLAGCQPATGPDAAPDASPTADIAAPAGDSADDVIVSTNEPFWQASVEGDTVLLRGVDAPERRFTGARASMTAEGRRIDASDADGAVVLIVRRMRCEDDMSGARFPMTGLLTIDGRGPFRGCARPASMPIPRPPGEAGDADASVLIPEPFLGRWDADADACRSGGSDMALRIEPGALRFHESIATPETVLTLDEDTIRVHARYEGEGETWREERILRLDGADALVVEADDGEGVRRVRCAG